MKHPKAILPLIVVAQFCCTSLWFAGNGVMANLTATFGLAETALGYLTSAVQLGFITGALLFAILSFADRFAPSKVFFICALLGAAFNLGIIWQGNTFISLLLLRFSTGFFLAGIYPVGMKIAADYYEKGLGKSLGFLVGALVVGTAFPHLLKGITGTFPWQTVLFSTSILAVIGGVLMIFFVPNGPFRTPSASIHLMAFVHVFKRKSFRAAAFGYFGHMWELYTFWAFVPVMLTTYYQSQSLPTSSVPLLSFVIIGIGGLACVAGGYISLRVGTRRTAFAALFLSCCCCLLSPFVFQTSSEWLLIGFLIFWGIVVIADSPLLSTLVAQRADAAIKGTALTIVNALGFFITIFSIQLINNIRTITDSNAIYALLAIGPILGLIALKKPKYGVDGQ